MRNTYTHAEDTEIKVNQALNRGLLEAERKTARQKLKGAPPLKTPEQRATRSPRDSDSLRVKKATSDFKKSGRTMRDLRAWIERTSRD